MKNQTHSFTGTYRNYNGTIYITVPERDAAYIAREMFSKTKDMLAGVVVKVEVEL